MKAAALLVLGLFCGNLCSVYADIFKYFNRRSFQKRVIERECGAKFADRQACGRNVNRISEIECRARACCWEDRRDIQGSPKCFLPKRMVSRLECKVQYELKTDCGDWGIAEQECTNKGCCYIPGARRNEPDCFYPSDTQLKGGKSNTTGWVYVYHDKEWGTVCDDNFGQSEADVVCRSLGFIGGKVIQAGESGSYVNILLDEVNCHGNEDSLTQCKHGGWGVHDCSHSEDVAVRCYESPEDMDQSGMEILNIDDE